MNRLIVLLLIALTGCATVAPKETARLVLKPSSFRDLSGWESDRQAETMTAFAKSCARILKQPASGAFGNTGVPGLYGDWQPACRAASAMPAPTDAQARGFFEQWFAPWRATADGTGDTGLFTGYYEASLRGSRVQHGLYQYPLRAAPDDLIVADLGEFKPEWKGQRITGRIVGKNFKPYPDNRAISQGGLAAGQDKPLVWVDDPVDAFFLQIQGSGTIDLDDGTSIKLGYAAQNGRLYYAVGRELVKRGELSKDKVSMQSIRAWMKDHPDQAQDLMFANPSYVFFRVLDADPAQSGPPGAEGVALTPGRSLAVDHAKIPYGVPVWLSAAAPVDGTPVIKRLMVVQDTGGAIQGPVRGDYFWGRGAAAEKLAGEMKSTGSLWLLLPKTVRP